MLASCSSPAAAAAAATGEEVVAVQFLVLVDLCPFWQQRKPLCWSWRVGLVLFLRFFSPLFPF